jgi:hypothetical protein
MEHEHGAFKVNRHTFPGFPLRGLRKAPKKSRFAGIRALDRAAMHRNTVPEI